VLGGLAAFALFAPTFRIRDVRIQGLQTALREEVVRTLPTGNLFLVDPGKVRAELIEAFPQFEEAAISKHWPNVLAVDVVERTPRGIWCRLEQCEFWDSSGAHWGQTAPSVGPLLLQVRDERTEEGDRARPLAGLLAAEQGLRDLGLTVRLVTLPDAEPGGMRLSVTAGYDLLIDGFGDIVDQLSTLEVFLADKANPPAGGAAFHPLYIDLRTPGRIYYK
jgi:hypothetical protein